MKVCPVCEMEEEDNALSCSMCGSDFEAEAANEEPVSQETTSEVSDSLTSDIADMGEISAEKAIEEEKSEELSDEEKLLEETLNATATDSSTNKTESALSKFTDQFSDIGKIFGDLNKRLDKIFLTKGKVNYIAPLAIVVLSILLLSGVLGLAVSTVPGTDEESTCLLYTSPSPRDQRGSRMPSSA